MSIYDDFPPNHPIWKVSNPEIVRDEYHRIYRDLIKNIKQNTGIDSEIYPSSRKNKKYMVFDGFKMRHFGDIRYSDYSKHQNEEKRQRYLKRFPIYKANDTSIYSPYNLSLRLLW